MQLQQVGHKHGIEVLGHHHIIGDIMQQHEFVHLNVIQITHGIDQVVWLILKHILVELYQVDELGIVYQAILKHGIEVHGRQQILH